MDRITIDHLEVFARHGVFHEEQVLGQKFILSAVLYTDTRKAGRSDSISDSTHYGEVSRLMKQYVEEHTFQLIETVAEGLAERILLSFPLVHAVDLEVIKPWAPIGLHLDHVSVRIRREWHTAFIALGSNMGDRKLYLDTAVERLKQLDDSRVIQVADYLETEPYGGVQQDAFLNSVLELRTLQAPEELLDTLHRIEQEAKRERTVRWGPRTLDLDILFYDREVIDTPELHIPHIDLENRDFVLLPMLQIAPYLRHPVLNLTIRQLKDRLDARGSSRYCLASDPVRDTE